MNSGTPVTVWPPGGAGGTPVVDPVTARDWILSGVAFPHGLVVNGDLDLRRRRALVALPDSLTVKGLLSVSHCTSLVALPRALVVERNLYLIGCTQLTAIPPDLVAGGSFFPHNCDGIANLYRGGRNYWGCQYYGVRLANGWRVIVDHWNLSPAEARHHWRDDSVNLALAEQVIAAEEQFGRTS